MLDREEISGIKGETMGFGLMDYTTNFSDTFLVLVLL
jgi:hypothetical protein